MKKDKRNTIQIVVDNFLALTDGWFQPNDQERIQKLADEFLYEDIRYEMKRVLNDIMDYVKMTPMGERGEYWAETKAVVERHLMEL